MRIRLRYGTDRWQEEEVHSLRRGMQEASDISAIIFRERYEIDRFVVSAFNPYLKVAQGLAFIEVELIPGETP
jgi:hypothetical protein